MEEYQSLYIIYLIADCFSQNHKFYVQLGLSLGYPLHGLLIIWLYSNFNYKLAYYVILMGKYLQLQSFEEFVFQLHHKMICMGLAYYYREIARKLNALSLLWPA